MIVEYYQNMLQCKPGKSDKKLPEFLLIYFKAPLSETPANKGLARTLRTHTISSACFARALCNKKIRPQHCFFNVRLFLYLPRSLLFPFLFVRRECRVLFAGEIPSIVIRISGCD